MDRSPAIERLAEGLDLTPAVVASRLSVLGLGPAERARLRALGPRVAEGAPQFLARFYEHLTATPATRSWVSSPETVRRLTEAQLGYLDELFTADYDWARAMRCLHLGMVHHRARLTPQWFVASYGHFVCEQLPLLFESAGNAREAAELASILVKSVLFDAALALDGYAMSVANELSTAPAPAEGRPVQAAVSPGPRSPSPSLPAVTRARVARDDVAERCAFLGIDPTSDTLASLAPMVTAALPQTMSEFYAFFSNWDETASLVPPAVVDRLRSQVSSYWMELVHASFDRPYAASRTLVGIVHERVGLSCPLYLIGLARQLESLLTRAVTAHERPLAAADALLRAVFFDVSFVLQAYVDARAAAVLRTDGLAVELLSGLSAAVVVLDERNRVEVVNRALLSMFGQEAGLVRFLALDRVVPLPGATELAGRAWAEEANARFSALVPWSNRTYRVTALRLASVHEGTKDRVALVIDDITEAIDTQIDAQADERGYAELLQAVQTFAWEASADLRTLSMVSRSAIQVTGHRDISLLGRPDALLALIPDADRAGVVARGAALAVGQRLEVTHRLLRAAGDPIWVRTTLAKRIGPDGEPVLCGTTVDITELHAAEQQRLDAVGKLAGGIAHEFNNQLSVVLSNLAMVDDFPAARDEMLEDARVAAERCATLTQRLLGFAQRQILRPRRVSVNQVLDRARAALAGRVGPRFELELELDPTLWTCHIDAVELEVALTNLLVNAAESMPGGGTVTLFTMNRPAAEPIGWGTEPAGADFVEIAVADAGPGMDERVRERAFEPFFTTKPQATGLGLALVHGFVAQSGGRVVLESETGKGTIVRLLFPRSTGERRETPVRDERPLALLVDDQVAVRRTVTRILHSLGYAVASAGTIAEALALVREQAPEVLVADVVLADGESGVQLMEAARALIPSLPVVFISGFTRDALNLTTLGARDAFVGKPFDKKALQEALDQVVPQPAAAHRRPG